MRKKRLLNVIMAVFALVGLLTSHAFAYSSGNSGYIVGPGTVFLKRGSEDYIQREYRAFGPYGPVVYCLESGKFFVPGGVDSPGTSGDAFWWWDGDLDILDNLIENYDPSAAPGNWATSRLRAGLSPEDFLRGIKYILSFGYPYYIPEGFTDEMARYATAAAMHWYGAACANFSGSGDGTNWFLRHFSEEDSPETSFSITSEPGASEVYAWALKLYRDAQVGGAYMDHTITLSSDTTSMTVNGSVFEAYVTVTALNMSEGYTMNWGGLTAEKIPSRSTVCMDDDEGEIITDVYRVSCSAGADNAGKTFTISAKGRDSRSGGNLGALQYSPNRQTTFGFIANDSNIVKAAELKLKTGNISGKIKITKTSSAAGYPPAGNSNYSLQGAVFRIYKSQDDAAADRSHVAQLTTGPDGSAVSGDLSSATYYIRETTAPKGFKLSSEIKSIAVSGGGTATVSFADVPVRMAVSIKKSCADSALAGNKMYSLAGARFELYVGNTLYETVTTDASGKASSSEIFPIGAVVTAKETVAPEGFSRASDASVTVSSESSANTVNISELPVMAPALLSVKKVDSSGQDRTIGWSPAIFKIEYFDNYDLKGSPLKTWYYKTDGSGKLDVRNNDLRLGSAPYASDAVFKDGSGEVKLPLGAYRVTEISAPAGYSKSSRVATASVRMSGNTALFAWDPGTQASFASEISGGVSSGAGPMIVGNKAEYHKINVLKNGGVAEGDAVFEGIKIDIINSSGHTVYVKTGNGTAKAVNDGAVAASLSLDSSGRGESGQILPHGKYTLKEVSVPQSSGYILNSAWTGMVEIGQSYSDSSQQALNNSIKHYGIKGTKLDAGSNSAAACGDAKLSGCKIAVINRSAAAVSVAGKSYAPGKTVLTMSTDASGNYSSGGALLPFGTYELRETAAPEGYKLNRSWSYTFSCSSDDADGTVYTVPDSNALKDSCITKSIRIRKWDSRQGIGSAGPQSPVEALENIGFEVVNKSLASVVYNGRVVAPGEVVEVLRTAYDPASREYAAQIDGLPYGSYSVRELYSGSPEDLKANPWYLVDDDAAHIVVLHGDEADSDKAENYDSVDTRIGNLVVSKTVSGNMGNKDRDFSFSLKLGDNKGVPVRYVKTGSDGRKSSGTAVFSGGNCNFTLKHSESMEFSYVICGNSYTLSEPGAEEDGYTVSFDGPESGTVDQDVQINVENYRSSAVGTGASIKGGNVEIAASSGILGTAILACSGRKAGYVRGKKKKNQSGTDTRR